MSRQLQILLAVIVTVSILAGFLLAHFFAGPTPVLPSSSPDRSSPAAAPRRKIAFPQPETETQRTEELLAGRQLFFDKGCWNCHRLGDEQLPGTINLLAQGPDLGDVGKRLSPEEIFESIVNPNAVIAEPSEKHATGAISRMPSPVANLSASELLQLTNFLVRCTGVPLPQSNDPVPAVNQAPPSALPAASPPPPPTQPSPQPGEPPRSGTP